MSNPWVVTAVTVLLIASSAFFVASEFALIAARRHRLEDAAASSRSARAALRSAGELSLLLAGAQLGITVCTLLLGAITKPAVQYGISPILSGWGLPLWIADVTAFILSLVIVTFLHLVVGEMAPKSWAIAHPERSASMLAIPMRAFIWLTRPLLTALNQTANWSLRKVGVTPVDELAAGQDPSGLRQLVEHSATVGTLDESYHTNLVRALELQELTLSELSQPDLDRGSVPVDADPQTVQSVSERSGYLRLLVRSQDEIVGVVHVRDTLAADRAATAGSLMRPALALPAETPVYEALQTMRDTRSHVVVVTADAVPVGLVTVTDVLHRLLPETV